MDTTLATTIVSTSGAVVVGLGGMWISTNQMGRRMDDIRQDLRDLRMEFNQFKDMVNGKFAALDLEIAKLMDKRN
jgi:predicted RNA-binding protein with PIN domain